MRIYTDGATSKNGTADAIGGWAYIIVNEITGQVILCDSGSVYPATNNICELLAVINGCKAVQKIFPFGTIYSDSAYIVNCYKQKWYKKWISNGWFTSKGKPVANKDLWLQLIPFFEDNRFNFEKVEGHSGNYYNEMVDTMAVEAREYVKRDNSNV